jgi:hypothetical protein
MHGYMSMSVRLFEYKLETAVTYNYYYLYRFSQVIATDVIKTNTIAVHRRL